MIERDSSLSTEQKALSINLDERRYGAIVEIGAGQEVARQFFAAGAAAGTIAKTASAYDMKVSDEIYGKATRYVSRERVRQMMEHEYDLLIKRLADDRSKSTTFFSYAATVTARSYTQKNECHGWIGVRAQLFPGGDPSEIILHVRMRDETNREQSEALGIVGVNLIHALFNYSHKPKWVIESLLDGMDSNRIEVDLIDFSGPGFEEVENRLMNLHLVRAWCCRAVMYDPDGNSVVPASILRKQNTLVIRGSFRPPTNVNVDMVDCALEQFCKEDDVIADKVTTVAEITMAELADDSDVDDSAFLARVDLLTRLGYTVLVSDYLRFFRLRSWIRRYTRNRLGIILSVRDFNQLFDESFYDGLEGGTLEAMGKLFSDNTYVYVYPALIEGELVSLDNVEVDSSVRHLLEHLVERRAMVATEKYVEENLGISSEELQRQIALGDGDWEQQVPSVVAEEIKARKLLGYPG